MKNNLWNKYGVILKPDKSIYWLYASAGPSCVIETTQKNSFLFDIEEIK